MSTQPSYPSPYPPLNIEVGQPTHSGNAALVSEASEREMSLMRDLNRPQSIKPELVLREPSLPEDFADQATDLDRKIFERGVAIDREQLLSLGKARFQQLLAADREARQEQRTIGIRTDLTDFGSVFHALAVTGAIQVPVPPRKMRDQFSGANAELDEVRVVTGFEDLWKASGPEPRAVRAIGAFRGLFESAVLAQSMLERLSGDGKVRSRFFCGGNGSKVGYFMDWLRALQTEHHQIDLSRYSQGLVFWLSGETSKRPDLAELAKEFFNVRQPSQEQIAVVSAMFEAFLAGLSDWNTWEYVGRATRTLPNQFLLKQWRDELNGRFRRIQLFHRDLQRCFLRPVGDHYQLDAGTHRRFVEQTIARLTNVISQLAALAVDEVAPGTVVARFQDQLLLKRKPPAGLDQKIAVKLHASFTR